MASTRKLQGEIDRVLKQIAEHMQEFDQIWQKVHSAPTPNLKEKYEGDLKKEIKKLQRFRDQLKSWATNNDIKNKKPLLDARKSIETEMERFKVLEKETKTKAYSKEGLNSGLSRRGHRNRSGSHGSDEGEGLDPREDPAKKDTFAWLDELEDALGTQVAELDEKLEGLRASSKKKKSAAVDAQVDDLTHKMNRHQYHIDRLQLIKDRLEHDELQIALVEDIHDDLDYYLHSNHEADFQEDETLYDGLELDKDIDDGGGGGGDAEEGDDADADAAAEEDGAEDDAAADEDAAAADEDGDAQEGADEEAEEEEEDAPGTVSSILKGAGGSAKTPTKAKQAQAAAAAAGKPSKSTPASSPLSAAAIVKGRAAASAAAGPTPVVPAATVAAGKQDTLANIVMKNQKQAAAAAAAAAPAAAASSPSSAAAAAAAADKRTAAGKAAAPAASPSEAEKKQSAPKTAASAVQAAGLGTQKTAVPGVIPAIAPAQLGRLPPGTAAAKMQSAPGVMPPPGLSSQTPPPGLGLGTGLGGASGGGLDLPAGGAAGAASSSSSAGSAAPASQPGVAHKDRGPVPDEYLLQLQLLDPSLRHLPDPSDSERPRSYLPRNPYRTPSYFPSLPAPIFEDPVLYEQLSVDTLFFIFYFQQGTPHQYLAARELKKQSWRYHKNFLTWFQRHDDPKMTTDDFESGTYVYFDYDSGWTQRIKADFTFEYRHLEDELQVPAPNNL